MGASPVPLPSVEARWPLLFPVQLEPDPLIPALWPESNRFLIIYIHLRNLHHATKTPAPLTPGHRSHRRRETPRGVRLSGVSRRRL